MRNLKTINELTIKDNFMFGAVMCNEEICREFLEMILGFPIESVTVCKEKSMVYHPEYKGIRLDVMAKDEHNTHYNVEMQVKKETALPKRNRYYHSQIDMDLLDSGKSYEELPDTYVIFVCDFDPFGKKRYRYTFENCCLEDNTLKLRDGSVSIFLSTKGENRKEVPEQVVQFLEFVGYGGEIVLPVSENSYVCKLQKCIEDVKANRELGGRYMILREMLATEYAEGKAEGKAESVIMLLELKGVVSEELKVQIMAQSNEKVLDVWLTNAAKCVSVEEFVESIKII